MKRLTKKDSHYGIHMSHCYQGENMYNCKYSKDDICPAIIKSPPLPEIFYAWAISDIKKGVRKFIFPNKGYLNLRSSARSCLAGLKFGGIASPKARVEKIEVYIKPVLNYM